jgi:hypothetical protein
VGFDSPVSDDISIRNLSATSTRASAEMATPLSKQKNISRHLRGGNESFFTLSLYRIEIDRRDPVAC